MPVSAAITFRMAMGSGYVAVMRGTPVTPSPGAGPPRHGHTRGHARGAAGSR